MRINTLYKPPETMRWFDYRLVYAFPAGPNSGLSSSVILTYYILDDVRFPDTITNGRLYLVCGIAGHRKLLQNFTDTNPLSPDSNMSMDSISSSNTRGAERNGSLSGLEQVPYTVLAVAGARVYHTKLNVKDSQWVYSHWKGTLTFGRDVDTPYSIAQGVSDAEKHWFRLADDETGRTVWMFKFPEHFHYVEDRPFFHVFQGRTRQYGFLFNDDDEATLFGRKVITQLGGGQLGKKGRGTKSVFATRSKSLRSLISSPAPLSFKHVAHVGVSSDGVFEASSGLEGAWADVLRDMQGCGISEAVLRQSNFGDGFWKGVEAVRTGDNSDADNFKAGNLMSRKMVSA